MMYITKSVKFLIFPLMLHFSVQAQKKIELKSPDGNLIYTFQLNAKTPWYKVVYKGIPLIENSPLGFSFEATGEFGKNLTVKKPRFSAVKESYDLVVGKTKTVQDDHRQVIIPLIEQNGAKRQINLIVRAFNDGIAFRYEFPEQSQWKSYVMLEEESSFNIAKNPTVHTLFWDTFSNSHEGLYATLPYDKILGNKMMDLPALFEYPNHIFMAITEANLRDYAGMYLKKSANGSLKTQLSPLPGQTEKKVKAVLPHKTPWRVMMIGDKLGVLMESNILTSLNEPSKIKDVSWIKPGKTTFHWWNGDITPDTTFAPGINFETNKYYIDFAARNNIEYHAVIGYGGFAWYKSDAAGYSVVGPHTDVTQTVPSLNMDQLRDYAKQKGVSIDVWVNWKAIYPKLEEAFSQFQKWGIKGMMVDFMDRDDQEMVNIQEEILKKAAEHELYIQFHGSFKPTGLHRTYPNEFTREGTYNYEQNKWLEKPITAEHDLNIVFIRMLAGASDYHLGGFRAVPLADFKPQHTRPLMGGTRCHMLAMYVVLESYLQMVADYPAAYEGEQGFEFIQKMPTVWDEVKVLSAELGKYVTIARRKGTSWYVGSINNSDARTIEIPMKFLSEGHFEATSYEDAVDANLHPNKLIKKIESVDKRTVLKVNLAAGGGNAIQLIRQ
ncbi:alpha-glucosidase [Pedobacter sp. UYEF25]